LRKAQSSKKVHFCGGGKRKKASRVDGGFRLPGKRREWKKVTVWGTELFKFQIVISQGKRSFKGKRGISKGVKGGSGLQRYWEEDQPSAL